METTARCRQRKRMGSSNSFLRHSVRSLWLETSTLVSSPQMIVLMRKLLLLLRAHRWLMCCRKFYFCKESTICVVETSTVVRSPQKRRLELLMCHRNFNCWEMLSEGDISKWHLCASYWMVNISSALVQMLFITWNQVSWTLFLREWKLRYLIMMYRKCRMCWNLRWIRYLIIKGLLHHYLWVKWNNSWNWHVSRELWRLLVEWQNLQIWREKTLKCNTFASLYIFLFYWRHLLQTVFKKETNKQKTSTCLVIY